MKIPVLMYHCITEKNNLPSTNTPKEFKDQIKFFIKSDYRVVFYEEFINSLQNQSFEGDEMVITFDDGTKDFIDEALPVIKRYNIKSTLFLASGLIGSKMKSLSHDYVYDMMSEEDIKIALKTDLVKIESHTVNHKRLTLLSLKEVEDELRKSKEDLEKKFNIKIEHFSYPKGIYNDKIIKLVKRYYKSAVSCDSGLNWYGQDLYKIKRIWMNKSIAKEKYKSFLK